MSPGSSEPGSVRLHDPLAFAGRVEMHVLASEVLRGNPLGDPATRELPIYVPPGVAAGEPLPLLLLLSGFTGRGQDQLSTHPWRLGVIARHDRRVAAGEAAPALIALPDCFTRLGGSQYVDSPAVGRYEEHVVAEVLPLVERAHPVARRAVLGKSSGGFGALRLAMRHPGLFSACASISGDCGFDMLFPPEFLACLRGLVPYDMDPRRFLAAFREDPDLSGDGHAVIDVLAMAACYSPDPGSELGFRLPFDLATGELVPEVWERWLRFDPLVAAAEHADALRALDLLHVECGLADEFHLQWANRRLSRELTRLGIPHVHEEHPGSHRGIDDRTLRLLDRLAR